MHWDLYIQHDRVVLGTPAPIDLSIQNALEVWVHPSPIAVVSSQGIYICWRSCISS